MGEALAAVGVHVIAEVVRVVAGPRRGAAILQGGPNRVLRSDGLNVARQAVRVVRAVVGVRDLLAVDQAAGAVVGRGIPIEIR